MRVIYSIDFLRGWAVYTLRPPLKGTCVLTGMYSFGAISSISTDPVDSEASSGGVRSPLSSVISELEKRK